ncbi:BA75_00578T0 [Komagataella pastoris]|uniref:BA75_00578T0 n=1 Tax=Komagataella pastoris TaxID=4922 RepID=A0A1B2J9I2_PICPA|nr:BA75_00578T0 [Komagataella pastoris]
MKLSTSILLFFCVGSVFAHTPSKQKSTSRQIEPLFFENGNVNLDTLNDRLTECAVVQEIQLVLEKQHGDNDEPEGYFQRFFNTLFPFGPSGNALLATTYISGPPNLLLALIPSNIDPSSLSILVSFAVGGLLGDVFLHLLPQTFVGEPFDPTKPEFILVDTKRNTVLGVFIFVGFAIFWVIDKSLRILEHEQGVEGNSHGHSHSHVQPQIEEEIKDEGFSNSIQNNETSSINRKEKSNVKDEPTSEITTPAISNPNASVKTSAYLNLISDFTHNITDGLAIAASFSISQNVGCTTTLAVFFHEIPHEIGDFALLIQGGFSKWAAMKSQFVTAIGAYLGTFIGIAIQNLGSKDLDVTKFQDNSFVSNVGILGTSVQWSDVTLPFTAGGFLYIATVGVIPEILELSSNSTRLQESGKGFLQAIFMLIGLSLMFFISWLE